MSRQPATRRTSASNGSKDQDQRDQRTKRTKDKETKDKGTRVNRTNTDAEDYRTTSMRLRRDVIERAKVLALRQRLAMAQVIEAAVDEYLAAHELPRSRRAAP
jgi:hypothetical protein